MADAHQSVDVEHAGRELSSLHQRVCQTWGRVEITPASGRNDHAQTCVLISKSELESMERALEILCDMPGGRELCENIASLSARCVEQFADTPRKPERLAQQGLILSGDEHSPLSL